MSVTMGMCQMGMWLNLVYTPPACTCSKLTTETLEKGLKYVQR